MGAREGAVLGFELRSLNHAYSPFCFRLFQIRFHVFFCRSQPRTAILLSMPPMYLELQSYATVPGLFVQMGS
jgi:hypothetical protein